MPRDPVLRLRDILEACDQIAGYIAGYDVEQFQADRRTSDAVIRQFEIIGEAVKGLPDTLRQRETGVPWQAIAGFRDVLSHAYFAIDLLTVWDAATAKLPSVQQACERLLASLQSS